MEKTGWDFDNVVIICIALVLVFFMASIVSYAAFNNKLIATSTDPLATACALSSSSNSTACLTYLGVRNK